MNLHAFLNQWFVVKGFISPGVKFPRWRSRASSVRGWYTLKHTHYFKVPLLRHKHFFYMFAQCRTWNIYTLKEALSSMFSRHSKNHESDFLLMFNLKLHPARFIVMFSFLFFMHRMFLAWLFKVIYCTVLIIKL